MIAEIIVTLLVVWGITGVLSIPTFIRSVDYYYLVKDGLEERKRTTWIADLKTGLIWNGIGFVAGPLMWGATYIIDESIKEYISGDK